MFKSIILGGCDRKWFFFVGFCEFYILVKDENYYWVLVL